MTQIVGKSSNQLTDVHTNQDVSSVPPNLLDLRQLPSLDYICTDTGTFKNNEKTKLVTPPGDHSDDQQSLDDILKEFGDVSSDNSDNNEQQFTGGGKTVQGNRICPKLTISLQAILVCR